MVWFFANIASAVQGRDIPHGFGFLDREYSTPIGHDFLPYESSDSFLYAILVGVTNTLFVSIIGVILATLLGIAVGVARMSNNWIVSKAALVYVEFFRNVPSVDSALLLVLHSPGAAACARGLRHRWQAVHQQRGHMDSHGRPQRPRRSIRLAWYCAGICLSRICGPPPAGLI